MAFRLAHALGVYAKTAWWGLVRPRAGGRALVVPQAVIRSDRGVLLSVRSDLWGWELPGGAAEPGESSEQAVVREVREETGLEVAVERRVGDYHRTGFRPHKAVIFACCVTGGSLRTSSETRAVAWFSPGDLPDTLFPWYRRPIEDAYREAAPVERHEVWGLAEITQAIRIDLRLRFTM